MLPYRAPGIELPEFNDLQDLHKVHHMLAERVKKWPDRWIARGREEGREQGLEQGRSEGRKQAARAAARNLIDMGLLSDEQIAEAIGLPLAEIRQLRRQDQS